jgi:hypothetical protein
LIAPAAAFAPSRATTSSSSALRMADVPVGVAKFPGFLGKTEWNRLTTEWGTADTGTYLQAAYVYSRIWLVSVLRKVL